MSKGSIYFLAGIFTCIAQIYYPTTLIAQELGLAPGIYTRALPNGRDIYCAPSPSGYVAGILKRNFRFISYRTKIKRLKQQLALAQNHNSSLISKIRNFKRLSKVQDKICAPGPENLPQPFPTPDLSFAIEFNDGSHVEHDVYLATGQTSFSDPNAKSTISYLGEDRWQLTIENRSLAVSQVWFPFDKNEFHLDEVSSDNIIYYPHLLGVAESTQYLTDTWKPEHDYAVYPGYCFSPLVITADDNKARIVASENWPPKLVAPRYSKNRMALLYKDGIAANTTASYVSLIKVVSGDAKNGAYPWQIAIDQYKPWLKQQLNDNGLQPKYSTWLKEIPGWLNFQLESHPSDTWYSELQTSWLNTKNVLPWVQFWGQMSDWIGPGPHDLPGTGCCNLENDIHPRYLPNLLEFSQKVRAEGKHIGFYSRPQAGMLDYHRGDYYPNVEWLDKWLANQSSWGANAFYMDQLGATYLGDANFIANLLQPPWPEDLVIEHSVDVFPAANLISGAIFGNVDYPGRADMAINAIGPKVKNRTPDKFGQLFKTRAIKAYYYTRNPPAQLEQLNTANSDLVYLETRLSHKTAQDSTQCYNDPVCLCEVANLHWCTKGPDDSAETIPGTKGNFVVQFKGQLRVAANDTPLFLLKSSSNSILYIDDLEVLRHNGGNEYSRRTLALSAGFHNFDLRSTSNSISNAYLELRWDPNWDSTQGVSQILDESYLFHEDLATSGTFPALGRYLLNDHIIFLGHSNADHYLWGYGFDRNYYTERQAFLLGAKLDARYIDDRPAPGHVDKPANPNNLNPIVRQIISERNRVSWWTREPRYFDMQGISGVSEGFEVRKFIDKDGKMLIVVDNWDEQPLLRLNIHGHNYHVWCPYDSNSLKPAKVFIFETPL